MRSGPPATGVPPSTSTADRDIHLRAGFDWRAADCYLFDIDGTLLNTHDGVHYRAFSSAFRAVWQIEETIDGVPWHGNTDIGIIRAVGKRAGIAEEDLRLDAICRVMGEELALTHQQLKAELCPSVAGIVQRLHSSGKILGVATGNIECVGWTKLDSCGLRKYFQFGSFSSPERQTREEVFAHGLKLARDASNRDATVYVVGDTPADIRAARHIGIPIIAVATGKYSYQDLSTFDPDMLVRSFADVT